MFYNIEKKPYGIKLTFDGLLDEENARKFASDFEETIDSFSGNIGILIDLTKGMPMPGNSQLIVNELYNKILKKGLTRSANIVTSTLMKMQMVRLAKEHGTYDKARYIDASANPGWEKTATDWIENSIDPDK